MKDDDEARLDVDEVDNARAALEAITRLGVKGE